MRPVLPLLPIEFSCAVLPTRRRPSPRRPPTLPSTHNTTFRSVIAPGTAPTIDADVVGVAFLAAEARRRGGMMIRERGFFGRKGRGASPLLRSRVNLLEKDVKGLVRSMVRAKAKVKAQLRTSTSRLITKAR